MRKFDLTTLPIMDATGEVERQVACDDDRFWWIYNLVYCEPTGMRAFPLVPHFAHGDCIAVTTDGEMLFTETQTDGPGPGFLFKGTHEKVGLAFRRGGMYQIQAGHGALVNDSAVQQLIEENPGVSTWRQLREKEQHDELFRLSDRAYAQGLSSVIEPIELAMLKVYNSAQRR